MFNVHKMVYNRVKNQSPLNHVRNILPVETAEGIAEPNKLLFSSKLFLHQLLTPILRELKVH